MHINWLHTVIITVLVVGGIIVASVASKAGGKRK